MRLFNRNMYLDKLTSVIGTPDIKIITGIRRSGKSILLELFIDYLNNNRTNINIVYLNLQELENEHLLEYHKLHEYALNNYKKDKENYFIVDEIQLCDGFEKAINSLHTKQIYDMYLTGSNAFLLSSDLATLFTGRTFSIEIYPFSFKEFVNYFNYENHEEAFKKYLEIGGFAGGYFYDTDKERKAYIRNDIYETIIHRDLVTKYNIRNKKILENLTSYMMDNISNLSSVHNITNYLNSNDSKITDKTINNYIKYLCNAFVFYKASRYDVKGKKLLATDSKYYLCDHSIRQAILGSQNIDFGRLYENIVYMELLRRGYDVYVGKLYQKEVDFVATKYDEKIYFQVSSYIDNPETFKREVTPLLSINDNYKKVIIATTHQEDYTYEGIVICDICKWLLEEDK